MKHGIILLALIVAQFVTAQDSEKENGQILKDIKISFEMGSIEDIDVLNSKDLTALLDYTKPDESIELEIICNFDHQIDDFTVSNTSITIKGNTSDKGEFTKKAEQVQKALNKLYKKKDKNEND